MDDKTDIKDTYASVPRQTSASMPRHSDMMIKICGMRDPENVAMVAALTPMLMGFIFHEPSPRHAGGLDPETVKSLPGFVRPVAVTVNAPAKEIDRLASVYGFRIFQLHGDESPEFCRSLRERGYTVFKAIQLRDEGSLQALRPYHGCVDTFVFDTPCASRGGSGEKFDWSLLDAYEPLTPYLLSGGIGPDDAGAVIAAMRPGMAGIDINSRFETAPGIKNISSLTRFIISLRKNNEDNSPAKPFWEKA